MGQLVIELEQNITEITKERDDALNKKDESEEFLKEFKKFHENQLENLQHARLDNLNQQNIENATIIPDSVSIVSDDQILKDFQALKELQKDIVAGSIQGLPQENEAFHKHFSKEGAEIILDKEVSKLLSDVERETYKEIHAKYQHSGIEWKEGKEASISKNGVELFKLSNADSKKSVYQIDGHDITNYRSLELPLKVESGPVHMSLAIKDLEGENISTKNAAYLTAHYDKAGKLVEMTTPIPVYYSSKDKESPVCIKRDGKLYTLPVNRGKYEAMQKEIEKNKGLQLEVKTKKAKDSIIPEKNESLTKDVKEIATKLAPYTSANTINRPRSCSNSSKNKNELFIPS